MTPVTESIWSILDPYGPYSKSQCRNCKYLIDGHCDMICEKHKEIPMDIWNNKEVCTEKETVSEKTLE